MVMEEQKSDMELDSERIPVPQVQKSIEDSHIEKNNKVTGVSRSKPRLRKKALHDAILKQMEFYFSDANLSKDRFLGNLIKENPYVDLGIFIRFNRIRNLTTDTDRIAKALAESTMLSLSEDGTKVRRVTPIVEKENIDDCTVYVQNLPSDVDHEMLTTIFSEYGSVVYVSLPRYKSNRKIKGFAFVEFDKPEYAEKCMKSFQKKGCVLPSHTDPNELLSITTFDDTEKDVTLLGRPPKLNQYNESSSDVQINESEGLEEYKGGDAAVDDTMEADEHKVKKAKKRKHKDMEPLETGDADSSVAEKQIHDEEVTHKKKKRQHRVENNEDGGNVVTDSQEKIDLIQSDNHDQSFNNSPKELSKHKKKISSNVDAQMSDTCDQSNNLTTEDSVAVNSGNEEQENTNNDKKKKRKRKRKSKIEDVSYIMRLQVMPKREWKYLRNKYLVLQRSKMKQLKQHLRKPRWNQWSNYEKNKPEKEEHDEKDKVPKQDNPTTCRFSFTPNVIVKIQMDKPCTDPKNLKMELKGDKSLKYIDISEGSYDAYVRCDTAEAAQVFAQKSNDERRMTVLQGEEERRYWEKIERDREEKVGKKVRVKQRGRNKLLKKAEKELGKHIKFDEV